MSNQKNYYKTLVPSIFGFFIIDVGVLVFILNLSEDVKILLYRPKYIGTIYQEILIFKTPDGL